MEGWKQRSKILVDQIHAVDPYYVPTNEYRFIGQVSYADITAGRTSPSSRNCSPYRQQRDTTPPATTTTQVLRPAIARVQKLTVECPPSETQRREVTKTRVQRGDANLDKPQPCAEAHVQDQSGIDAEDDRQDVPEVVIAEVAARRGRSPTRKANSSKMKESLMGEEMEKKCDNPRASSMNVRQVRAEVPLKNTLGPHEERRGRSPSPMWVPGSTSYADILRGYLQTTQTNVAAEPLRQEMIPLSGDSRRARAEVPRAEPVKVEVTENVIEAPQQVTECPQPVVSTQKMEGVQVTEGYCQPPEKVDEQSYSKPESADWTDKALEDYNVLQHHVKPYEDVPCQPQPAEIYDYIIPEPELVGFIGSQLGTYPVSSYVYAPPAGHHHHHHHHHQQVQQQLDPINLDPYNNGSLAYAPEHYVAQTAYLSATEIYQQTQVQQPQQQQCPADDMRMVIQNIEKPVQMQVTRQPEVEVATEHVHKLEQEEPVAASSVAEAPLMSKPEEKDASPLMNNETKTFSYAQILSQGLSPRVTPTRVVGKTSAVENQSKERSYSPKESLSSRELSPSQESKILGRDLQQPPAKLEQPRQSRQSDWDTMKKRDLKKKQQSINERSKQAVEKKSQNLADESKERQKKEKSSPPKQTTEARDEPVTVNSSAKKEEKPVQQEKRTIDSVDTSPQERKRKQKKKRTGKSGGDEIDKALKEIEDMDKQKAKSQKDKPKEQNKPREAVIETNLDKSKNETDKKQSRSDEKSKKSSKSKGAAVMKEITPIPPIRQDVLADKSTPKDNIKTKEDINGTKDLSSKGDEEDRKSNAKEELKDQLRITDDSHVDSNKLEAKTKHKNKTRESTESAVQQQSSVSSDNAEEKTSTVDESSSEIIRSSDTPKVELKDTIEKPSTITKAESKSKEKDTSKKEQSSKNKTKSKVLKLEAEYNNRNQKKLENGIKETSKSNPPEFNKPSTDAETHDPKALDVTRVVEVNGNVKGKTNSRKKDKISKGKIKADATTDLTSPIIPTSETLNETKVFTCLDNTEKLIVPKSKQIAEEISKIVETPATFNPEEPEFKEMPKEIVLSREIIQQTAATIQTDITHKNDQTDEIEIEKSAESKGTERYQADTDPKIESPIIPETLETTDEKKAIISEPNVERPEKQETEKRQTKTGRQKRADKTKSNTRDRGKAKEAAVEVPLPVESKNKSIVEGDKLKVESSSKSPIEPAAELFVQPVEKANLAKENASVSDDSCLLQSKSNVKDDVKQDEKEITADVQVNKRAAEITSKSKKKGKSKDKSKDAQQARNVKFAVSKPKYEVATTKSETAQQVTSIKEAVSPDEIAEHIKTVVISDITPTSTSTAETESTVSATPKSVAEIVPTAETSAKIEGKHEIVENQRLDHLPQEAIAKDEEIQADATIKAPLIRESCDTEKSKDLANKEKASKHTKSKKLESTERAVEQTKHFKDDSTEEKEFPEPATCPTDRHEAEGEKLTEKQPSLLQIDSPQEPREPGMIVVDSKLSSDLVDEAEVLGEHDDEARNESPQPSLTGKALIIEKTVTTVTTTTSVPGSVKIKPPDVKSVKSVEILENIPLPKIIGSKVTELISLRPETVEASLTTTYARVLSEVNPLNNCNPVQSADQATDSQRIGSTCLASAFAENILTPGESALFGSVQDRKRACPEKSKESPVSAERKGEPIIGENEETRRQEQPTSSSEVARQGNGSKVEVPGEKRKDSAVGKAISGDTSLQNDDIAGDQTGESSVANDNVTLDNEVEGNVCDTPIAREKEPSDEEKIENQSLITKDTREEKTEAKTAIEVKPSSCEDTPKIAKPRRQMMPEHLLDLVKPYALDRRAYNQAESNFYRYFKVVRTINEPQSLAPVTQARPESIVRIVQESVMKPAEQSDQEEPEVSRRHALIMEAPKYPLASFYEFESHWVRAKSVAEKSLSVSSDDTEISIDSVIEKPRAVEKKEEVKTVAGVEESTTVINVEKLEATNEDLEASKQPQAAAITEVSLSGMTESLIIEDRDEMLKDVKQTIHLVSDDSWMSFLDEPMIIDDDFDDTAELEEIKTEKTTDKTGVYVDDQNGKREIREEQSSKDISNVEEAPCEELSETDLIVKTGDSIPIGETSEVSVKSPTEENSDAQLKDTITNKVVAKDKVEIVEEEVETKAASTVTPYVHLESDDAWMSLLEEEIIIDDDFDAPEIQVKKEGEIEEERTEKNGKMEKIEQQEEEAQIPVLSKTDLTEIAVKDEYLADVKHTKNEIANNEKQMNKGKNQSKKKKESKQTKEAKAKDQKSKARFKKQNEIETKSAVIESESLPQCSSEEVNVKATDIETKNVEKPSDGQQAEKKSLPEELVSIPKDQSKLREAHEKPSLKREETKSKSAKKAKKQSEKPEVTQEKSAKRNGKINDNVSLKETESNATEISATVQKQQDSKDDMPKYDSRLNPNAKSWAAIVGTKSTTETTVLEEDSSSIQAPNILYQDIIDSSSSFVEDPRTPTEQNVSLEVPLKSETCVTPLKQHSNQNVIEESKTTTPLTAEEAVKPVVEKSAELSEQLREGSKSYAEVVASSRRTSPQSSQEEMYLIKPVALKSDHRVIDVRTFEELCNNTDKLQSSKEQEIASVDEAMIQQIDNCEIITAKFTPQIESVPWVEEVEKEISIISPDPHRAADSKDTEILCLKPESSTWAAIVGKKSAEPPEVNNFSTLEQVSHKPDQNVEQRPLTQVQIYVDEAPEQEPIEKLVQVDDQGFMEFVNRKELRSRRSRSRSRSNRREDGHGTVETSDSVKDKETKLDAEVQNGENATAKEEVENKQPAQEQEIEQKQMVELMKVVKENVPKEIVKPTKSKDKSKQKKDSNERKKDEHKKGKKQSAEIGDLQNGESKVIQEAKSEQDEIFKGTKAKAKKSKSAKDSVKQKPEIKVQKELKDVEETIKGDFKPAGENETSDAIRSENIVAESEEKTVEDQSTKEVQLMADIEVVQEIKNKDAETLSTAEKKSKKRSKNKKGKTASERSIENAADIGEKVVDENLEKKIESPIESKIDDEVKVKLEEGIAKDVTHDAPTSLENEEISAEKISKQENIEQQIVTEKVTEQESVEQKVTISEFENIDKLKESRLEIVEENTTEQKEMFKPTKTEKRKQKKKTKASSRNEVTEKEALLAEEEFAQDKLVESSSEINIAQEIIVELTDGTVNIAPSEDKTDTASELKKDNETITEIQAVQMEEPEATASETNETSLKQVTAIVDKQKQRGKSKSKKEKRQQDDKTVESSREDSTTNTLIEDSKKIESLTITENAETLSSSKDVTDEKKPTDISQSLEDKIDTNDLPVTTAVTNQQDTKESEPEPLVSSTKKETNEEPATTNVDNVPANEDTMNNANTPSPSNKLATQAESANDSTGTVIKHSPSLDKLSFIAHQSSEDEDRRVASIEQESPDSNLSPPKSKVQFYIADEILILKPEKRKDVVPPDSLVQKRPDDFSNSRFLSIDGGFWPDKRPYHEAERDHFENLALNMKKSLSRDPDDRHRPQDRDGDNSGGGSGGGGGKSRDSCGNSRSLLGAPQTERMVADLPGGICSWSDYSTYLSSESERMVDPTIDSGLSLHYSSPSVQSPPDLSLPSPLSSYSSHDHPQTESRTESPVDAEVSPRECPAVSCSSSLQSPDHPNTRTWSSTSAHLRPQSKLHLGRETTEESARRCSPNGVAERETVQGEAERRIRRIQVRPTSLPVLGLVLVEFDQVHRHICVYTCTCICIYTCYLVLSGLVYLWFYRSLCLSSISFFLFLSFLSSCNDYVFVFPVRYLSIQCVRFSCAVTRRLPMCVHMLLLCCSPPAVAAVELIIT